MTSSISVGFFSPSSLTGCVLWLDGSSLGLTNGATVSTWPSLGTVSYTTTSTTGRFPTYATNILNGRGVVQYATGQTSILSNFALPATQSMFLVYYPINQSSGSPFIEQGPDVNSADGFFFHAQNNNNYAIRNGGALGTTNFGTIAQTNTWQMIEALNKDPNANNTMSFYSNATLIASNGVQNGTATVTNTLFINGRNNTNTLSYPSYIAEYIVYNYALNNFGRQQVEGYLAWKWGLTSLLPSTHPYKVNPFLTLTEPIPRDIPSNAFIIPINTFSTIKTFTLPVVSSFPGRMIIMKDYLGYAGSNVIRLSTLGLDRIDRSNASTMTLSNSYGAWWFNNDGLTKWYLTSAYLNTLYLAPPPTPYPANPFILLSPTQTFPTYTTTSAPTFGTSFITFPGTSQFLDFGSQALTIGTTGFSAKMKISWTTFNTWARVFDFNTGANGATDMFLTFPGTTPNPLRFQYKENGSEQQTNYASNFNSNTIYNISVVYNPAIGSVGATTLWVNGTMVASNTSMAYKATNKTETFTYIGKSSYADGYLAANIYFLAFYQRALTDAEAGQIL